MRDPELVFKAQLAASALERAWHRWRVMHGLVADPMPAISSYVGYSLEEPWGQPRVVFGVSANDAEQLAALLNRHDCIGPVHATVAGQQATEVPAGASRPLPVPPQAPSVIAEQSSGGDGRPAGKGQRTAGPVGEPDGPVYRQVARAAREAARQAAAAKQAAGSGQAAVAAEAGHAAPAPVLPAPVLPVPVLPELPEPEPEPSGAQLSEAKLSAAEPSQAEPSQAGPSEAGQPTKDGAGTASAAEAETAGQDAPLEASSEHEVPTQGVSEATQAEATSQSAAGDQVGNAVAENKSRRGDDDDKGHGGDGDGNGPGGNGPGGGGQRPGRVIAAAGRSRGRRGGESRANAVVPKTQGGGSSAASSGSGAHSAAEGSGAGADSRRADDPGDVHESNARAETRDASARAAGARVAEARVAEAGVAEVRAAEDRAADTGSVEPIAAEAADGPGPLALAASAARVATEARIRASMRRNRPSATQGRDAGPEMLAGGQGQAVLAGGQGQAVLAGGQGPAVHAAVARPEVASGAHALLFDDPAEPPHEDNVDVASAWGGPEFTAEPEFTPGPAFAAVPEFVAYDEFTGDDEFAADDEFAEEDFAAEAAADPDVVPLRPRRQDADGDAGLDPAAEDRPEHSPSSTARRNRITRGYSIPRLSRSKRPGAIPGL
jgi:hypothetical protein